MEAFLHPFNKLSEDQNATLTTLSDTVVQTGVPLAPEIPLFLHLVHGTDFVALIDSGLPQSGALVDQLISDGAGSLPLRYLCTTHAHHDHIGNHRRLRDKHGALVVAASGSQPWMVDPERNLREFAFHHPHIWGPTEQSLAELAPTFDGPIDVDIQLDGVIRLALGGGVELESVTANGHLPAELGWFETSTRTLVLGDAVIGTDWPFFHGHVSPVILLDTLRSLETFSREREVVTIAFSHYSARGPVEFAELVRVVADQIEEVRAYVLRAVGNGPASLHAVWQAVCKFGGKQPEFRALSTVQGHLDALVAEGDIRLVGPETYAPANHTQRMPITRRG